MIIPLTGQRFVGGLDDGAAFFLVENAQRHIGQRGGFFHQHLRVHHRQRHGLTGEMEVMQAALRLRAPQHVVGHVDLAHRVVFDAEFGHDFSLLN